MLVAGSTKPLDGEYDAGKKSAVSLCRTVEIRESTNMPSRTHSQDGVVDTMPQVEVHF
jgi:hypothetical protein